MTQSKLGMIFHKKPELCAAALYKQFKNIYTAAKTQGAKEYTVGRYHEYEVPNAKKFARVSPMEGNSL